MMARGVPADSANMRSKSVLWGWVFLLACVPLLWAGEPPLPKPGPRDKCPVCGMFVAKYPDWVAAVRFTSGEVAFFDGVKDMLTFYFNVGKYAPGKTAGDVDSLQVTDYYALEPIDGRTAFYVTGSDVFGPMGRELIPFAQRNEAEEFLRDHRGKAMHPFDEMGLHVLKSLE